ncbi:MAG: WecB/TagA/CpsF family glycosyltransferase [Patescibacteria group bacterium]|jgi:N-acetylglucosaminyldiphosphoundecaprenol N-acetyl-beta-D-mannosaminyltransferase
MGLINILGVNINTFSKKQALAKIQEFLIDGRRHFIITPNPEIILAAGEDKEFFDILNKADLSLPDGVGLKITAWLMGVNFQRITGADLLKDILAIAEAQGRRVAVFNWRGGLSSYQDISQALAVYYPKLQAIAIDLDRQTDVSEGILAPVREFKPGIIFLTLGAPYQEKFIFHNLAKLPSVKIGLGVGGAFDFLTGKLPRAPFWLRKIGLEWLWRLIKQPARWKRIYNAVIVFPVKFLIWLIKRKI